LGPIVLEVRLAASPLQGKTSDFINIPYKNGRLFVKENTDSDTWDQDFLPRSLTSRVRIQNSRFNIQKEGADPVKAVV
jgi:hypothetical protein